MRAIGVMCCLLLCICAGGCCSTSQEKTEQFLVPEIPDSVRWQRLARVRQFVGSQVVDSDDWNIVEIEASQPESFYVVFNRGNALENDPRMWRSRFAVWVDEELNVEYGEPASHYQSMIHGE